MEILFERKDNIDKFLSMYEKDRFIARIYAIESSPNINQVCLNETGKLSFQIFNDVKTYGVSTTLKLYARKKAHRKYFVNGNKFYYQFDNQLRPITVSSLQEDCVKDYFKRRFTWVNFLIENSFNVIPFNTIVNKRLYSRNDVLRYLYSCPLEQALIIHKYFGSDQRGWKILAKSITNLQNLNEDLLKQQDFADTAILAFKHNTKVNAAWSVRRLKEEHDKWALELTNLLFSMDNEPLKISDIYLQFSKGFPGLIEDKKGLALEGLNQKHCVAGYANSVNSGQCAIFNVNGFTAEVRKAGNKLYLNQIRGKFNAIAPENIRQNIKNKIEEFNSVERQYKEPEPFFEESIPLPF